MKPKRMVAHGTTTHSLGDDCEFCNKVKEEAKAKKTSWEMNGKDIKDFIRRIKERYALARKLLSEYRARKEIDSNHWGPTKRGVCE